MQTYSNSTAVCWSEAQWIFITSLNNGFNQCSPCLNNCQSLRYEAARPESFFWGRCHREKNSCEGTVRGKNLKSPKKNIRERWGMLYLCGSGVCVRGFHFCKPPPCKEKTKQDVKHVTHLRSFKFTHEDFPPLRAFPRHTYWALQRSVASPSSRLE